MLEQENQVVPIGRSRLVKRLFNRYTFIIFMLSAILGAMAYEFVGAWRISPSKVNTLTGTLTPISVIDLRTGKKFPFSGAKDLSASDLELAESGYHLNDSGVETVRRGQIACVLAFEKKTDDENIKLAFRNHGNDIFADYVRETETHIFYGVSEMPHDWYKGFRLEVGTPSPEWIEIERYDSSLLLAETEMNKPLARYFKAADGKDTININIPKPQGLTSAVRIRAISQDGEDIKLNQFPKQSNTLIVVAMVKPEELATVVVESQDLEWNMIVADH